MATDREIEALLAELDLHDNTGDPSDKGYMEALADVRAALDAARAEPSPEQPLDTDSLVIERDHRRVLWVRRTDGGRAWRVRDLVPSSPEGEPSERVLRAARVIGDALWKRGGADGGDPADGPTVMDMARQVVAAIDFPARSTEAALAEAQTSPFSSSSHSEASHRREFEAERDEARAEVERLRGVLRRAETDVRIMDRSLRDALAPSPPEEGE